MNYDKLIERLWSRARPQKPFIAQGEIWTGGMVKDELCADAATALETLRVENRRLNEVICSIPTTPDSGRTIGQYDKEMSMCAYLDDLEAENKSLRSDLARVTAERDAAEKEITRLKAIMREKGIFTIPAKYPWEKPEWNW